MSEASSLKNAVDFHPDNPFYSVSVVVPFYNVEKYIGESLEAILSQTFPAFEVIAVDDESQDGSLAIAESFGDRVRIIRTPNQGVSKARNLGAHYARGTWLAFCDSDDVWDRTKLEKQLRLVSECPEIHCVITDYCDVVNGVHAERSHFSHAPEGFWNKEECASGFIVRKPITGKLATFQPGIASTPIVRRDFFMAVGGFDGSVDNSWAAEDTTLFARCLSQVPFGVVPEVLMFYRRHPESISANAITWLRKTVRVWEYMIENYPQVQPYREELLVGLEELREEIWQCERYARRQKLKRLLGFQ